MARLIFRSNGGSALVEVVCHGLTLQSGLELPDELTVEVLAVTEYFRDFPLTMGDKIQIYNSQEKGEWALEPVVSKPRQQLELGLLMALPD